MSENVTIHKNNGTSIQVPKKALPEYRRMLGDTISRISLSSDEESPSVMPKEKQVIKSTGVKEEKKLNNSKPDKTTKKSDIQDWITKNYPGIKYQANDTKEQLLSYIKAAEKQAN